MLYLPIAIPNLELSTKAKDFKMKNKLQDLSPTVKLITLPPMENIFCQGRKAQELEHLTDKKDKHSWIYFPKQRKISLLQGATHHQQILEFMEMQNTIKH